MGKYNSMDAVRCFESVCRLLLRSKATPYCDALHKWILQRQAAKFRQATVKNLLSFGIANATSMSKAVRCTPKKPSCPARCAFCIVESGNAKARADERAASLLRTRKQHSISCLGRRTAGLWSGFVPNVLKSDGLGRLLLLL